MTTVLTSILAFLFAIGLLVAVHEYGHFWVARRLGFKVERFSIGFGKALVRWRGRAPDHVEYWISAIPLGGYVKLLDEREGPVAPEDRGRAFTHRPIPARIAVLLAGAGFNFAFAVLAFWFMFMVGVPGVRPVIGEVTPGSAAFEAGLRANDIILEVGGTETSTWEGALLAMLDDMLNDGVITLGVAADETAPRRSVRMEVAGQENRLTEPGQLLPGLGIRPWSPQIPPVLGEVVGDGAAARAGLLPGDEILQADGVAIEHWEQWVEFVRARPDEVVAVELLRDGQVQRLDLHIERVLENDQPIGRIGAAVSLERARELADAVYSEQRYGPLDALQRGAVRTWEMGGLTLRMMGRMITGDVSLQNLSGPINIAQYAGTTFAMGASSFLNFLAIVSLSLGILNLLPIPMLDGGQIVYQLVEWVKGSPMSERALLICQQFGLVILLMVMTFVFYQDIMRFFG